MWRIFEKNIGKPLTEILKYDILLLSLECKHKKGFKDVY